MMATKIKMKQGCSNSNKLLEIDSIYLEYLNEKEKNRFYSKESIYNYLSKPHTQSIKVNISPFPELEPKLSINNEKYVRSQPDSTTLDNLLKLPRE